MQWNNLYLIPIVLVGGLLAFGVGRTIVARVLAVFGRLLGGAANKVAATVPTPPATPERVYSEPPTPIWPTPRQPSLAERKEELAVKFLSAEDELIVLERRLREQDEEEARRARLIDEARKRNRSNNVLVGKLDVPASAGPMTQAIQLTEETLATLKAARDKQSSSEMKP